jgi:hypothetical protein
MTTGLLPSVEHTDAQLEADTTEGADLVRLAERFADEFSDGALQHDFLARTALSAEMR